MDAKWVAVVIVISFLAGIVGGLLGTSIAQGGMVRMMGMPGSMMMSPQAMLDTMRRMMLDPALQAGMVEMHRQIHNMMERKR
jgi:hypothetical protein